MSVIIKSGSSSALLEVDSNLAAYTRIRDASGNDVARSHRELLPSTQEALLMAGKNDQIATIMRTDRKGNTMIGNFNPELVEVFEGATLNVQKWTATNTTFAPTQSTLGGYIFNPAASTTLSAVAILQSQRLFYKLARQPLQIKLRKRHSMVSGTIADFGWGVPTSTTLVVPNGTQVRFTNSGAVQVVFTINSVETAIANVISQVGSNGNTVGANLNMSNSYYTNNYFVYDLIVDDDNAVLTIQDTATGELIGTCTLPVPNSVIRMWGATALPVYDRVYNNTAPSTAPVYITTDLVVLSTDNNTQLDASQAAAIIGLSAGRQPFTGAQNENHTNSAAPTSATLSNTAAGYTTLGGKFQFAAVAGAETDYAIFGFTVPAGSRFVCEGVSIDTMNTGAAVATTASVLEWALGFNSSAVSLATANIIRRQVGIQSFSVGAAIGTVANAIDEVFVTPEVVESGRFLHVILKLPIGTATASQVIRGQVKIKGRFI